MRTGRKVYFLFLFLSFVIWEGSADTISIATGEWPPYVSENLPDLGIAADITKEAFALENIDINWVFLPWKRAYETAKEGECDATILWVKTEERVRDFYMGDIIITGQAVFFHRKDRVINWANIADLQNYRIGGLLSASYPWLNSAKAQGINLKLELVHNDIQNFQKLLLDRIDIFSIDVLVGNYLLNNNFSKDERAKITFDKRAIEKWNYRILFPHDQKTLKMHLIDKFHEGLTILEKNGRYNEIIGNYNSVE